MWLPLPSPLPPDPTAPPESFHLLLRKSTQISPGAWEPLGFTADFSQVIIGGRICHLHNERKMNLSSEPACRGSKSWGAGCGQGKGGEERAGEGRAGQGRGGEPHSCGHSMPGLGRQVHFEPLWSRETGAQTA